MKHLFILTSLVAAALFASCTKDPVTEHMPAGTRLSLTLDGGMISATGSRATTGTRATAVDESAIKDLWVLQFNAAGTQLTRQYLASITDPSAIELTTALDATANSTLYLVANTGNSSLFSTHNLLQVKAITIAITTTAEGGGEFLPMPRRTCP